MKAAMLSIRPEWCAKIANGTKTIEVRKTKPKLETPFKCYIYCTKNAPYLVLGDVFRGNWETEYTTTYGRSREEADRIWGTMNGKVIGEFVCNKIFDIGIEISSPDDLPGYPFPGTGLTDKEIMQYLGNGKMGYGWHISELKIYDKPKELSEFLVAGNQTFDYPPLTKMKRPPQSWCYVEGYTDE
ncbi:MAG: hypothetical protein IKY62_02455 [Clostridia bacterium]|nr:hypothetical protein [Clostridia bacterium]